MGPPVELPTVRELYTYNRWAHERMLAMTDRLSEQELTQDMGHSHGSVVGTLVHVMWAEWMWLRRWKGESPRVVFKAEDYPGVGSIRIRWDEIWVEQAAFLESLTPAKLSERVAYTNLKGERWEYPLWQELLHVVNHGTYHRGQVANLVRQCGKPAVPTDLLVFYDESRSSR